MPPDLWEVRGHIFLTRDSITTDLTVLDQSGDLAFSYGHQVDKNIEKAAQETGMTRKEVRTALKKGDIVHWNEKPDTSVETPVAPPNEPEESGQAADQALKNLDNAMIEGGVTSRADPYHDGQFDL